MQVQGKAVDSKVPELPGFVRKWIAFTSPANSRQPQWREEVASIIFPIIFLLIILPLPTAIQNPPQLITLCIVIPLMLIALLLKKLGRFLIAGLLITFAIELGLASAVLTVAGGVDISELPLYALLIQTGFVVIAFFSPAWIWFIAIVNVAFTVGTLTTFYRHGTELASQLSTNWSGIIVPMVLLQLFVAYVCWVIMTVLIRTILRADTAEKVADLEHRERLQREQQLEISRQIEVGIEEILTVLNTATSTTDFSARVPLSQENILWRVGRALNNLLARLQGLRSTSQELEKTRAVATQLVEYLRMGRTPSLENWTGTCLDPIIIEINKRSAPSAIPPMPSNPVAGSTRASTPTRDR